MKKGCTARCINFSFGRITSVISQSGFHDITEAVIGVLRRKTIRKRRYGDHGAG